MWVYIAALLPSAGLLFVFYLVMKHILEADRRERAANAEWDRAHSVPRPSAEARTAAPDNPDRGIR